MNIIVTNKYKNLINSANIEILKELNGVFQVSELANSFNSIFYKKLIIDATAIDRFPKEEVLKELVSRFDTNRLILLLPSDNPPPMKFLSFLVSINLYNFTDNIQGLKELINKSNTFEDVKEFVKEELATTETNDFDLGFRENSTSNLNNKIILGVKDVTKGKNSTSLVYMLKKTLDEVYKRKVVAVEIDKKDFMYYNSNNMYSISKNKLGEFFANNFSTEIILVDLGNSENTEICNDVIYLVEPSLYRINELLFTNRMAFNNLKGKKIILVNSLLEDADISLFAREAGISIFFNLPPLNDRVKNPVLDNFLSKLGLVDIINEKPKKSLFAFFK